ncbi:hypothetical protein [Paenibacillus xylanexedens]|uniref:hypothetical protein n=1 Tax=Paenibacillus xylanexedens TaxID=528191 RepID=UPI0011A9EB1F|nr:hypothetical protein [Paenibacillus xylanexedens]
MKKLTVLFSIFSLILLLAVPTSFAATESNISKFEDHLKSLDQSDPYVQTQIGKYQKLSQSDKERFTDLVYDAEVHNQALGIIQEVGQPVSKNKMTTATNDDVSVTLADGDVVITGVSEFGTSKPSVSVQSISAKASEYSAWGSWAWTMTFLGIDLTTIKSKVFYTINANNKVLRSDSCVNTHSNIDPLIIVSDGTSSHFKSGEYAFGNGPFTVYGTPTLGFVSSSVSVIVKSKPGDTTGWRESAN